MGPQVERVPRGAPLDVGAAPSEEFGRWLERQRSLRGISIYFVAARTRLTPERVAAIENGSVPLASDGHGRAMARSLAEAVGADPQEAAAHLIGSANLSRRMPVVPVPWLVWGGRAGIALVAGLAAWLLVGWLVSAPAQEETSELVYRSDYVDELLERDAR